MPTISVLIPVYKVEKYLPRCIDSVLAQSFTDWEMILVDDGSPDRSGMICDDYAARDSRIRVIHKKNTGLYGARNAGLDCARGDWIAFVDSDDWLHRDYLKALLSGTTEDTDVVLCGCLTSDEGALPYAAEEEPCFREVSFQAVKRDHNAATRVWGRLYRRQTIGDMRFMQCHATDNAFNTLLFHEGLRYMWTDARLYYYFMRSDSAVHCRIGRKYMDAVEPLLDTLESVEDPAVRQHIIVRSHKLFLYSRYAESLQENPEHFRRECERLLPMLKDSRTR